jgi:hypothetical protein
MAIHPAVPATFGANGTIMRQRPPDLGGHSLRPHYRLPVEGFAAKAHACSLIDVSKSPLRPCPLTELAHQQVVTAV